MAFSEVVHSCISERESFFWRVVQSLWLSVSEGFLWRSHAYGWMWSFLWRCSVVYSRVWKLLWRCSVVYGRVWKLSLMLVSRLWLTDVVQSSVRAWTLSFTYCSIVCEGVWKLSLTFNLIWHFGWRCSIACDRVWKLSLTLFSRLWLSVKAFSDVVQSPMTLWLTLFSLLLLSVNVFSDVFQGSVSERESFLWCMARPSLNECESFLWRCSVVCFSDALFSRLWLSVKANSDNLLQSRREMKWKWPVWNQLSAVRKQFPSPSDSPSACDPILSLPPPLQLDSFSVDRVLCGRGCVFHVPLVVGYFRFGTQLGRSGSGA